MQGEVKVVKAKVARSEHRAILAEREVSFLQAMVVCSQSSALTSQSSVLFLTFERREVRMSVD